MGYVPPTLEEWLQPELLAKRMRRERIWTLVIQGAGLLAILFLGVLWIWRGL